MHILNSMYYFASLEVSWLVLVADWERPLRNDINHLLTDVSCWSQVIDPCLPFLKFYDYCVKGSLCVRTGKVRAVLLVTSSLADWARTQNDPWFGVVACPDGGVQGADMGPTWVQSASGGPHVDPIRLAVKVRLAQQASFVVGIYVTEVFTDSS